MILVVGQKLFSCFVLESNGSNVIVQMLLYYFIMSLLPCLLQYFVFGQCMEIYLLATGSRCVAKMAKNPHKVFLGQLFHGVDRKAIFEEMNLLGIPIPDVGCYIVTFWVQCVMS